MIIKSLPPKINIPTVPNMEICEGRNAKDENLLTEYK